MGGTGTQLEPQMSLGGSAQEPWIIDHPWSSRKNPSSRWSYAMRWILLNPSLPLGPKSMSIFVANTLHNGRDIVINMGLVFPYRST